MTSPVDITGDQSSDSGIEGVVIVMVIIALIILGFALYGRLKTGKFSFREGFRQAQARYSGSFLVGPDVVLYSFSANVDGINVSDARIILIGAIQRAGLKYEPTEQKGGRLFLNIGMCLSEDNKVNVDKVLQFLFECNDYVGYHGVTSCGDLEAKYRDGSLSDESIMNRYVDHIIKDLQKKCSENLNEIEDTLKKMFSANWPSPRQAAAVFSGSNAPSTLAPLLGSP